MGGQGRFVRGDSSCDRRCKGGALAGGCLQRDTSAAAAELALSCRCLRFYGTFITICHSFNGVACVSCHLPLPPCAPPSTHTHSLGSSAIWHRVILVFWVHPGRLWGQELGRVAQVAQGCGLGVGTKILPCQHGNRGLSLFPSSWMCLPS